MNRSIKVSLCVFAFLAITSVCGFADAQDKKKPSFNVKNFLKRLDSNQNGRVDPGEIKDDRTREFLRKAGVDPSKPINISKFSTSIKKKRKERGSSVQMTEGFAVDSEDRDEVENSPGFAVGDDERQPVTRTKTPKFSEKAKQTLEWTLNRYDKNKNGKIDANEIKEGRWADPPILSSDTNKDGVLNSTELLVRYQKREDEKEKRSQSRSKKRDSRDSRRNRDGNRDRNRDSSTGAEKPGNRTGNQDVRKGYENYVNGLFKRYDKNGDGSLDESEVEAMRRKPKANTDANKDGKISNEELLNSYLESTGQAGSKESKKVGVSKGRSGAFSKNRSGSSNTGNRPPLTSKDKNKNGQIEMSEFTDKWTTDSVKEFYSKDKNKDGIITAAEWNAK